MNYTLKSSRLTATVSTLGAELISVTSNETCHEYIYDADPRYWKRHSPVLFPIVGGLKNGTYTYNNQTYSLSQHGFARDLEFVLLSEEASSLTFRLVSGQETKKNYPFEFILDITYRFITPDTLSVLWEVSNPDTEKSLHFSIGGHPAFTCPFAAADKEHPYTLSFHGVTDINYINIDSNGLALPEVPHALPMKDDILPLCSEMFDDDALIIADERVKEVSILNPDGTTCVTVSFDTPFVGLWSPAGKQAPFLCIEPWYGRCDRHDADVTFDKKEYAHTLPPKESFRGGYKITFC